MTVQYIHDVHIPWWIVTGVLSAVAIAILGVILFALSHRPKKPRRWFSFSLRTMLVLVVVTAIPMGWVAAQLQWIRERQEARRWIMAHGGDIATENRFDLALERAPWSIALFGEQGIAHIGLAARDRGRFHELIKIFPEADYAISPRRGGPSAVP